MKIFIHCNCKEVKILIDKSESIEVISQIIFKRVNSHFSNQNTKQVAKSSFATFLDVGEI